MQVPEVSASTIAPQSPSLWRFSLRSFLSLSAIKDDRPDNAIQKASHMDIQYSSSLLPALYGLVKDISTKYISVSWSSKNSQATRKYPLPHSTTRHFLTDIKNAAKIAALFLIDTLHGTQTGSTSACYWLIPRCLQRRQRLFLVRCRPHLLPRYRQYCPALLRLPVQLHAVIPRRFRFLRYG